MKTLRIVIIDDSDLIRTHLRIAFDEVDGCDLVGMAADGNEGLEMVRSLRPDVVILDVSMPHSDGVEVLQELRKEDTDTVVIMFTAEPSSTLREICHEAGANFYLVKSQLQDLLDICMILRRD